jgi:TetR/AcrR family transcriptional regulator, transcriptional repressor for nem operon
MPHESKIRILEAALRVIRTKGYTASRIEDICAVAGLTKGSFFHHFNGKENMAVAAADYWNSGTRDFFERAPYHALADPLDRLLGYLDFRKAILRGALCEFTCFAGTLVQETYDTHPAIRDACEKSISGHAAEVAKDIAKAKRLYAPDAPWTPESLALYTQAVLQGAFILAKARNGPEVAEACVDHLKHHFELLFPLPPRLRIGKTHEHHPPPPRVPDVTRKRLPGVPRP